MQIRISIFLVIIGVALPACRTKRPPDSSQIRGEALTNVALPIAWKAGAQGGNSTDNWIATFQDPQLDSLVREALVNNPDLRIAATKVEQSSYYVDVAKAALKPQVTLLGTGGIKGNSGGDVSSALQGIWIGASWEPDLWGRLRYGRNAAQAQYASASADFEFAQQSLAAATARGWFTAIETLLQRQTTEEMVQASRDLLTFSEQRFKVGIGNEQDVVTARANVAGYEDSARQARLAHQQALRALELLLGRYPAAELAIRNNLTRLPSPVPAGMPLEMLERRPDLLAAERRVAAAFNRVGEAKAARLPRIVLNGSAGAISSDLIQLKEDFKNPTSGAGARLVAPIYQGGALKAQVNIRTAEQKQAVAEYAQQALRALNDVESALAQSQILLEREIILKQKLADNLKALQFAKDTYRVGRGDLRAVQEQQLGVHTTRQALLRVQSEQLSQRVNLHLALGGSWNLPPAEPMVTNTVTRTKAVKK